MDYETLTMTIHAEPGIGKTRLAATAPAPRLFLDAENGTKFMPRKVWEPTKEDPPTDDGTWETCVVLIRNFGDVERVYQWLNSGKHPFKSVILDSLSEIQSRCMDAIVQSAAMAPTQQQWGQLLRQIDDTLRGFRDLAAHQTNPIKMVVFNCLTFAKGDEMHIMKPYLQGQISMKLPAYTDVIGYLYVDQDDQESAHQDEDGRVRKLLVQPVNGFTAKDRTGTLPPAVVRPRLDEIINTVYSTGEKVKTKEAAVG